MWRDVYVVFRLSLWMGSLAGGTGGKKIFGGAGKSLIGAYRWSDGVGVVAAGGTCGRVSRFSLSCNTTLSLHAKSFADADALTLHCILRNGNSNARCSSGLDDLDNPSPSHVIRSRTQPSECHRRKKAPNDMQFPGHLKTGISRWWDHIR